jgi:hypothetical protein
MRIGLIAMSGVRVFNPKLVALGLTLPQFINRGEVIAQLPSLALLILAAATDKDIDVKYNQDPDHNAAHAHHTTNQHLANTSNTPMP